MGIRLERQGEDSGQGGHSARPAAPDLRRQAAGGWPHALGLQHPEGVDAPPRAAPPRWWPQVQPVEEGALEDALEVEEEAHPPPPAQAQEDAPALQVSALLLTARPRAEYQQDGGIALTPSLLHRERCCLLPAAPTPLSLEGGPCGRARDCTLRCRRAGDRVTER